MLFKKPKKELPPLMTEADWNEPTASYDQVLDFLVAVNKSDFEKIIKVANLHRKANCDVAKITGMKHEPVPSIFDRQTVPERTIEPDVPDTEAGNFLDEDDELNAAFLNDDDQHIDHITPKSKAGKNNRRGKL